MASEETAVATLLTEPLWLLPEFRTVLSWSVEHSLGRNTALSAGVVVSVERTSARPIPLMITTAEKKIILVNDVQRIYTWEEHNKEVLK